MKNTAAIITLLASALCVSCVEGIDRPDVDTVPEQCLTLTATVSDSETKTDLGSDNHILWQAGDRIATVSRVSGVTQMYSFNLSSGAGTTEGIFTSSASTITLSYPTVALYPVPEQSVDFDDRSRQTAAVWKNGAGLCVQTATPGSFDPKANLMAGTVKAEAGEMKAVFKNLCSYVKFTISDFSCSSVRFEANEGNKAIAADKVLMLCDENGTPVKIEGIADGSSRLQNFVTLTGKDGAAIAPGTYLIAVLPCTLDFGFTIYFEIDGKTCFKTTQKQAILKRSGILNIGSIVRSGLSSSSFEGSGTDADPYRIAKAEDLKKLAKYVNDPETCGDYAGKCYIQTADIDCGGAQLAPIGYHSGKGTSFEFTGKYNGQGYSISNYVQGWRGDCCALFGYLHGAGISSLTVSPNSFDAGIDNVSYVGGIAGLTLAGTAITDCHLTGGTVQSECVIRNNGMPVYLGGMVGFVSGSIGISGCTNSVELLAIASNRGYNDNADVFTGGIVGCVNYSNYTYTLKIDRCRNYADINSSGNADSTNGGIVGMINDADYAASGVNICITNCVNSGDVCGSLLFVGTVLHLGGVVGYVNSNSNETGLMRHIVNCLNTGDIIEETQREKGSAFCGGICGAAGVFSDLAADIHSCASTGDITYTRDVYGTLSGCCGDFHYCYWTQKDVCMSDEETYTQEHCSWKETISSADMNAAVKPSLSGCTYASWTGTSSDYSLDILTSGSSGN